MTRSTTSDRRRARLRAARVLAFAALGAACSSSGVEAPSESSPAREIRPTIGTATRTDAGRLAMADRLLEHSKVESIIGGRAGDVSRRVAVLGGDLTDPELERLVPAVQDAFAPSLLRRDIAGFLADEAPEGVMEQVLASLDYGANAELRRVSDAYEPPGTLEAYAEAMEANGLDTTRVRTVARWATVRGAGDFYVLVDEALSESAYDVLRTFRPDTPPFAPLTGDALAERLQTSLGAALVTFMYRLETVPDELLERASDEYDSPEGQWFVETYSLAVAEAIRAAGQRAVAALESGSRSRP